MKKDFFNRLIIVSFIAITILTSRTIAFASSTGSQIHYKGTSGIHGTITAINGAMITISTIAKIPVVYTVDVSKANILGPKGIRLASLTTGEKVSIEGTVSGTNVTAQGIILMPSVTFARGTLSNITPTGISVSVTSGKDKGSTKIFTINKHTRLLVPGTKNLSISSLRTGDQIMIMGMMDPVTGNFEAMDINDFPTNSVKVIARDRKSSPSLQTTLGH